MYLIVLFCPPLYFLIRKKWGCFILSAILMTLLLLTIMVAGFGIIFWALAIGHAGWEIRKEGMQQQAELIAKEMVNSQSKVQNQEQPQVG